MVPLAELLTVDGRKLVFDPENVAAVHVKPREVFDKARRLPQPGGPAATHVWGITTQPQATEEPIAAFLARLKIERRFISVTLPKELGPVWLRAASVTLLRGPAPSDKADSTVKCYVVANTAYPSEWGVVEDIATVRALVDKVRTQGDSEQVA